MAMSFGELLKANNGIATTFGGRHDGAGNAVDASRGGVPGVDESSWADDLASPDFRAGPGGGAAPTLYDQLYASEDQGGGVDYSSGNVESLDKFAVTPQVMGPIGEEGQFSIQPQGPLGGRPELATMVKKPIPTKTIWGDIPMDYYMSPVVTRDENDVMIEPESTKQLPGYGEIPAADFKPGYTPGTPTPPNRNREDETWKSGRVAWTDDEGNVSYIDNMDEGNWGEQLAEMPETEQNPYADLPEASQKVISDAGLKAQDAMASTQAELATASKVMAGIRGMKEKAQANLEAMEASESEIKDMEEFLAQARNPAGGYDFDPRRARDIERGLVRTMDPARDSTNPYAVAEQVQKYKDNLARARAEVDRYAQQELALDDRIKAISQQPAVDPASAMDQMARIEREKLATEQGKKAQTAAKESAEQSQKQKLAEATARKLKAEAKIARAKFNELSEDEQTDSMRMEVEEKIRLAQEAQALVDSQNPEAVNQRPQGKKAERKKQSPMATQTATATAPAQYQMPVPTPTPTPTATASPTPTPTAIPYAGEIRSKGGSQWQFNGEKWVELGA